MSGLLGIGTSGLNASQAALNTIANNIANADNPDYSRQTIESSTRASQANGLGSGVEVGNIQRIFNYFAEQQLQTNLSSFNQYQLYNASAHGIDNLMASDASSLLPAFQNFFSALQETAEDPSSIPARQVFIEQGNALATRFNTQYQSLVSTNQYVNTQLSSITQEMNTVLHGIADLNTQISQAGNEPPLELLDQRQKMLKTLSEYVSISTVDDPSGAVNIYMSGSQPLLLGATVNELKIGAGTDDPSQFQFQFSGVGDASTSSFIQGGQLGGLLAFRDEVLNPSMNKIGQLATVVADVFNSQHQEGMDLDNNIGNLLFQDINSTTEKNQRVVANQLNSGVGLLNVSITDSSKLTSNDYQVRFTSDSGGYEIKRLSDSSIVGSGTVSSFPHTISFDGLQVEFTGGDFKLNDSYKLTPTRFGAQTLNLTITDPRGLAFASPIIGSSDSNNIGSGEVSLGTVTDITHSSFSAEAYQLSPPLKINFLSATTYEIRDANTDSVIHPGPLNFMPGLSNTVFPADAVSVSSQSGLIDSGTLSVLNASELTLNNIAIPASNPANDTVSSTDNAGSAIAIAAAINSNTTTHNVTAIANKNSFNLGVFTPGVLSGSNFSINGVAIDTGGASTETALINNINTINGITAESINGEVVITADDGRNIQLETAGSVTGAQFSNYDLSGIAQDKVQRSTVRLSSSADFTIAGTNPADINLSPGANSTYDPGYTVDINGTPERNDSFYINYNTNGIGDNRNAVKLGELQYEKVLDNGNKNFTENYTSTATLVSTKTHQSEISLEVHQILLANAQSDRDSISGVNLDEEAAKLIKYEQAYQANARVIAVASSLFDILISTFAR